MRKWIFCDVEATGKSPINGMMTEFGAVDYNTRQKFHGVILEAKPDPKNLAKSKLLQDVDWARRLIKLKDTMELFNIWLQQLGIGQSVFISDNPAYDYQWINCAFDEVGMENPFGHSARRISDFYAGLMRDWTKTQEWKRLRVTKHDHNPVHDAMGNVEAFEKLLELAKNKPS